MKILAINGSPRGMSGTTGRLLEEVLAGAEDAGAEVEIVCLADTPIQPCVACDACHRTGLCIIRDGYEQIKKKLHAADGYLLASPNYIFSVTAQMKAFVDRCNGIAHCTSLEGKYAALVETSGGGGDEEVLNYLERVVNSHGAQSVGGIGSPCAGPRMFPDQEALFEKARALGRDLCESICEKRSFPEQDAGRLAFRARMQYLTTMMSEFWHYERDYWANR